MLDKDRYGPWAVIAGASDGTGAAFAREIAAAGINVLLVARRAAVLETLAADLREQHDIETRILALDLSSPDAARRMADAVADKEVGLYISNAGADSGAGPFLDADLAVHRQLIALNILTVTEACYLFGGPMRARGRGGVVLMGSGAGIGGQPGLAIYSAAKAFIHNLAEALWGEWRGRGVDVMAIVAPIMDTPKLRATLDHTKIPGLISGEEVAHEALERLRGRGPTYVYALAPDPEENERQSEARRARVLQVEAITAALFPS